jgi:2-methylisocitrate lyase-like PEP mutase family enzyme
MSIVAEKRRAFRRLHEQGCFVMPNPWDVGTTRWLQHLAFPALATTSAGAAFAMGLPDSDRFVSCDAMLEHVAVIAAAADVPVNADFGSGYGAGPAAVAANVRRCVETGVAGLSIEDSTGDDDGPLFPTAVAVERLRAARAAIDEVDPTVVLTARAECYLVGVRDVGEVVTRLRAYADAGADCLYAPGLATRDEMRAVVEAVAPKPVNVLAGASHPSTDELAVLGVRRVSLGSALARVAWNEVMRAANRIASEGRFDGLSLAVPGTELNRFFTADARRRRDGTTGR